MRKSTEDLEDLSILLDSKFKLPLGIKIGWDGILGLIPGIGDILTSFLSYYIILRAALLGCSASVLIHMALNVFIDNLIAMVPILGNIGDFLWKSNNKNVNLLKKHMQDPGKASKASMATVIGILLLLLVMSVGVIALGVYALIRVIDWLFQI